MGREVRELLHKGAHFILFTGIGNVGDINEQTQSFSALFMETTDVENLIPFFIGQGKARRVISRRVENDQQRVLFFKGL